MFKIKNVIKSNESKQVTNIASVTGNSGTYVKMGVTTHNQYNSEVSLLNYQKDTKYQKYTINNVALYSPTDETLVKCTSWMPIMLWLSINVNKWMLKFWNSVMRGEGFSQKFNFTGLKVGQLSTPISKKLKN